MNGPMPDHVDHVKSGSLFEAKAPHKFVGSTVLSLCRHSIGIYFSNTSRKDAKTATERISVENRQPLRALSSFSHCHGGHKPFRDRNTRICHGVDRDSQGNLQEIRLRRYSGMLRRRGSDLSALSQQNHLPGLNKIPRLLIRFRPCSKPIEIYAARSIGGIPVNTIQSGSPFFIDKRCHLPSQNIVNLQRHLAPHRQSKRDGRFRIERIGIVLLERVLTRRRIRIGKGCFQNPIIRVDKNIGGLRRTF